MRREKQLEQLASGQIFDVLIVGGGASGAGAALDAALRGLKVALIDANDFAGSTSGRSTKLIHGGVRYLEQAVTKLDFGQLRQVQHGLQERRTMLRNAPHLAQPLELITPTNNIAEALYLYTGLMAYRQIAGALDVLPQSTLLNRVEAEAKIPTLAVQWSRAVSYFDGNMDDARYCLALVKSAERAGATVLNHTQLLDFEREAGTEKIVGATLLHTPNHQQFTVAARCVVNCTGPMADALRLKAQPRLTPRISASKGVHIVLPGAVLSSKVGLLVPKTPDGRVVFALPFGAYCLVGTTDTPFEDPMTAPLTSAEEIEYLLETLQPYLAVPLDSSLVLSTFAALRPLVADASRGQSTARLLRDHVVEIEPESGLISLMGGKWTTYRIMAQDAIDAVCLRLNVAAKCATEHHLLVGAEALEKAFPKSKIKGLPLTVKQLEDLFARHGFEQKAILERMLINPALAQQIHPECDVTKAELQYFIEMELAATIHDVLAQRLRLHLQDTRLSKLLAPCIAESLAQHLNWSAKQQAEHIMQYLNAVSKMELVAFSMQP